MSIGYFHFLNRASQKKQHQSHLPRKRSMTSMLFQHNSNIQFILYKLSRAVKDPVNRHDSPAG